MTNIVQNKSSKKILRFVELFVIESPLVFILCKTLRKIMHDSKWTKLDFHQWFIFNQMLQLCNDCDGNGAFTCPLFNRAQKKIDLTSNSIFKHKTHAFTENELKGQHSRVSHILWCFSKLVQGDPKKCNIRILSSNLEVRFYFSAGVLEPENRPRFIWLLQYHPFRIKSTLKTQ